ncbi:MAG: OmpH family outer membrane protein [Phycisphaerales bacterium]|nr:OmpH family outer membrane protein [Phycisphaerales bacterium]
MSKFRTSMLVMLAVALVLGSGMWVGAQSGKSRPVAAAVVDVLKLFDSLAEKVQADADMQTRADRLQQEGQERERKLQDLQKDLEVLAAPGSAAHTQKQDELEKQAIEFQTWRNFQSQKLQRERAVRYEQLYRKMTDSLGKLSKENGFDIIFFKEGAFDTRNVKPEQLGTVIQLRKVLWASDDLDLTDMLVQRMNNEFKNSTAPKTP